MKQPEPIEVVFEMDTTAPPLTKRPINIQKTKPMEGVMKPTELNILGINYSVEYVDSPSDVDIHGRETLFGQIDFWTRSIRIHDNGRDIEDIWQILIHEILHGIAEALNLKLNDEEMHDELDSLATAIGDTLIRNGLLNLTPNDKPKETVKTTAKHSRRTVKHTEKAKVR
jgi:hypothetical protein